jgi:hypothetical protein
VTRTKSSKKVSQCAAPVSIPASHQGFQEVCEGLRKVVWLSWGLRPSQHLNVHMKARQQRQQQQQQQREVEVFMLKSSL